MKKIIKKFFKKKKKTEIKKESNKKLPATDYDGMGNFKRFGKP